MKRARAAQSVPADRHATARDAAQADPPAATKDGLLTAAEAAAALRLSLEAFYAWRVRHRIPNAIPGRTLRFRLQDLLAVRVPPARPAPISGAEFARQVYAKRYGAGGAH